MDIQEGNVLWTFPDGWSAMKFDDWSFFRKQFQGCADGNKAMDILAMAPDKKVLWMIEPKDYKRHRREPKKGSLAMEVAEKARDTLSGILVASMNAANDEKAFAQGAVRVRKIRVVLHLEQARRPSRLHPEVCDRADVTQKLKQLLKAIDPHPIVMSSSTAWQRWTTTWSPNETQP